MDNRPAASDEFTLLSENHIERIYVRSWRPGDGLTCSHAKSAPSKLPCGRPVAVAVSEKIFNYCRCSSWEPRSRCRCEPKRFRRVVCLGHMPELKKPHEINAEATRVAHERLAAAHWDEWQKYVDEEVERAVAAQFEFADPEIRRIVLGDAS